MSTTTIIIILGVLMFGVAKMIGGAGQIDGAQARQLVDDGALLLDVRTAQEFAAGHLPNAKNISVAQLDGAYDQLGAKDGTIVVYCASGMRSARAKRMLEAAGFEAVHDLGGKSRW